MNLRNDKAIQVANIMTPFIGLSLSIPGLIALIIQAVSLGTALPVVTFTIFGVSLVISYAIFTLYHIFKFHQRWGRIFKILDHATIYLLIAGTYSPFTLVLLRGNGGWILFGMVWAMAVLGMVFKTFYVDRFKIMAPVLYLFMGWLIVFAIKPVHELMPAVGLKLLVAGGLFYSFGLIFYAWKRLLFHHAIWHLFVLAGSGCHYFAIYFHVNPPA